ncbi:MAG: cobalamin-dependent protein [Candidatus Omnitrophica bacterium]|nr:cobalamin-dependent protein [Candidatus Omnitrophota bacterium]
MSYIVLWNSIAKRRRSISDTFYDNGLGTLKGYLEDKGHCVDVIDWARDDVFQAFSPLILAVIIRKFYSILMISKMKVVRKLLGAILLQMQEFLSAIQRRRLNKAIMRFAYELKKRQARILGIKLWYGDAFRNAKYLISIIKKIVPEIVLIAGGYHLTLYEEHLFQGTDFDLGVVGEAEYTLEKILNLADNYKDNWNKDRFLEEIISLAQDGEIENLLYHKNGKVFKTFRRPQSIRQSKSIPHYLIDKNKVRIHVIVESLGCDWGKCHFCVHSHFYPHYSLRDPEELIREIEAMLKIGIGIFRFAGSDTPPTFGMHIAEKIKERGLKIIYGMGSRPIKGARHQYDKLVTAYSTLIESGLRSVFMGGESGNDFINQEVMNKGVVFEDIVYTVKALRQAESKIGQKVYLSLALIYPAPLLGKITLNELRQDNIRLLDQTFPDSVMITPPGPFLHTEWYEQRDKFGFEVDENIIKKAMEYEYVLYKPPHLWPELGISLEGRPFKILLEECNEFRRQVEQELNIPTDLSDEHFLMFYAAGIRDRDEILKTKRDTMLDIVSCDYRLSRKIARKVNIFSYQLATGQRIVKDE